ncbi:hypothetical protein SESBI_27790 [Sesbania bispinosa]|nr:hypothetical protein SESBI_27790 [Sesbania bispinosa]
MDLWVVAAAAGAGYLAKYWNKISRDGDSSYHLSSEGSYFENPESPNCPLSFLKQVRRGELGKDVSRRASDGKSSDVNSSDAPLSPYDDNFKDIDDGNEQSSDTGNHGFFLPDSSAKVVPGHKTFLRSKHFSGNISRPLNSLESCFIAQLYKEHAKMEEYVFSPLSSPSTTTRSFLVSNGSRIINRENDNSFNASFGSKEYKLHKEAAQANDEIVFGVPSLPKSRRSSSSNDVFSGKVIHTRYDFSAFYV